jgi:hypothetical protein
MDRQDIDALLIGALYGELTPADEARLAAHLESHPADKSALDGMKVARDAVKQSRIFDVQAEPPQAISAILLQEAARRAPKKVADPERRESWFARFVRTFASHPAMAAAAMLVVVVGVAGTLYMRNSDQFAEKTAGQQNQTEETAQLDNGTPRAEQAPAAAVADAGVVAPNDPGAAGSGYSVGLAEGQMAKDDEAKQVAKAPESPKKKGYIEVTTPDRMPKEMDSKNAEIARGDVADGEAVGGAGGAPRGAATNAGPATKAPAANAPETTTAQAAPSVAQATPPVAHATPPARTATTGSAPGADYSRSKAATVAKPAPAQASEDKFAEAPPPPPPQAQPQPVPQAPPGPATNSALLGWAKAQHAQAIELVKKGDCTKAAKLAVQVKQRAPDYFAQNMRDDRQLKSCLAYITDAAEKDEQHAAPKKAKATDSK